MSYLYLATVYSKHEKGIEVAFAESCRWAARFVRFKTPVFCPIAHFHPIAMKGLLDPLDHNIWLPACRPFMEAAEGLIVVTSNGWRDSVGIAAEIAYFDSARKPIHMWNPDDRVPDYA